MTLPAVGVQVQGGGSVGADQLNTYVQWASNVAVLRAVTALDNMAMWLEGTNSLNDGGQGMFYWDSTATTPDDDGVTTIQPNGVTGAGRWLRQPILGDVALTQLADIPGLTMLGNPTGGTGPVLALTVAQVLTLLGITETAIPPGTITMFGGQTAPAGWYICDGTAVSRTTDAALFAAVGTAFGPGNGSTTFNLPNFLGYFPRGWDSGGLVDPARTFGSTQLSALEKHQHIADEPSVFITPGYTGPFGSSNVSVTKVGFDTAGTGLQNLELTNDGTTYSGFNPNPGGQVSSTETRPINVAVAFIIKR